MKKSKKEKTKTPDYLLDVIELTRKYDQARLGGHDTEVPHKKLVKAITICNNIHGKGYVSISKARSIIQAGEARVKEEALVKEQEQKRKTIAA